MEITKMYNGEIELKFNEERHHYTVDGETVDGVTSVLNIIAKPALIYWSANKASEYIEKHLQVGKAIDEIEKKSLVDNCKKAHRDFTTRAADIGTMFHTWVEQYILKEDPKMPTNPMLRRAVEQFLKWATENEVEFRDSERIIYSKKHGYAGTMDFTAVIDGKTVAGDIKTSSGIWDEYWLQLAAYKQALQEEFPSIKVDHTIIVRCGKDGAFEVQHMNDFEQNLEAFLGALTLHRRMKELKFNKTNQPCLNL